MTVRPMRSVAVALLLCLLCWSRGAIAAADAGASSTTYLLLPQRVWNGSDAAPHAGWAVLVRDGAIVAVGAADAIGGVDAQRIELPGTTP